MKNDKLSLIEALQEVKFNSWVKDVSKSYNVSEQNVRDLYENNLQTAYNYLNALNEEGKGLRAYLGKPLEWIFGAGQKAAKDAEAPAAAAQPALTPAEIRMRAQEKTIDDLAAASGAKRAGAKELGFSPQGMKTTDFGKDAALKNIKLKKGLTPDEAKAKLDSGARPQDINTRNTARLTIDPTDAGRGRPATDLKPGDMRSSLWAKGPPTNAGVAKADADFNATSKAIGARRAAEKSASEVDMPKNNMGNIKAKADTDLRTKARTDAEAKAKSDAIRGDTVKKVAKGLAGAAALGTAATVLSKSTGDTSTAASAEPAGTKMKVAKGDTLSQIAQKNKVSVADLMKANQGIKDVHKIGVGQEIVVPKATNNPVYQGGIGTKAGPAKSQNIQKPKTVKEENENSLISAFLKIQASGSTNLFEAAKKAKKDWDKDGKIESEKDEVWGSRFRAAGIQKEESEAEKAKKNPMSHERDSASSRIPNRELTPDEMPKKKVSKVVQTGKNTSTAYKVDEEVEISEARESFTKGTRKIKSYALGDYHAEVRHNPDWQEYQVHFYKNGKHMGEGPVSYHGEDKEDAHDSAKAGLEFLNKRNNMSESVSFSDSELEHLYSIAEGNPIAPVPDDYSGAAGGVSKRDLSDETVAEGIRGMRRKDSKFKDDPKKYSNEYPKSYREPGTMSKAEMRDHIEASVRKYLRAGGKIKKN